MKRYRHVVEHIADNRIVSARIGIRQRDARIGMHDGHGLRVEEEPLFSNCGHRRIELGNLDDRLREGCRHGSRLAESAAARKKITRRRGSFAEMSSHEFVHEVGVRREEQDRIRTKADAVDQVIEH